MISGFGVEHVGEKPARAAGKLRRVRNEPTPHVGAHRPEVVHTRKIQEMTRARWPQEGKP